MDTTDSLRNALRRGNTFLTRDFFLHHGRGGGVPQTPPGESLTDRFDDPDEAFLDYRDHEVTVGGGQAGQAAP
jgi:hypothetical protein